MADAREEMRSVVTDEGVFPPTMASLNALSIEATAEGIVEAGRRLYARGLVGGSEGNVSVRLDGARVLATPAGTSKGFLEQDQLVVTDMEGRKLSGGGRPSSELRMHLRIYALREDVRAIVHAHPPTATGFAIAGRPLDDCVVPEVIATLGWVPIAPYGTPSTEELPDQLLPYIRGHDALLLANHGAVTYSRTLERAVDRMESIEQAARSILVAHLLGNVNRLSRGEVDRLLALGAYGSAVRNPGCPWTDPTPLAARNYPLPVEPPGALPDEGEVRKRIASIVQEVLGERRE